MNNRNIHIYVAYETARLTTWREELGAPEYERKVFVRKPFSISDTKAKKLTAEEVEDLKREHELEQDRLQLEYEVTENRKQEAYDAALAEKALTQLHTCRAKRIVAAVFDFDSPEQDPPAAVPPPGTQPTFFSLTVKRETQTPGFTFLKMLQSHIGGRGKGNLLSRYVSWRGQEPRFLRLLIRLQTMRMDPDQLQQTFMPLYFQCNTFDWNSVVGAEKYGDTDRLMAQLGLAYDLFKDPLHEELSVTLQLFARAGLAPKVDLVKLMSSSAAGHVAVE